MPFSWMRIDGDAERMRQAIRAEWASHGGALVCMTVP